MGLSSWFARLPLPVARRLHSVLRHTNLMRAVEMHHLEPWAGVVEGWRVLDVGCGHGFYSVGLALRGAHLIGCDLSVSDLDAAQQTARGLELDHAAYLSADASALPFTQDSFDLVICNCVLEHVASDLQALVGMCSALRPGGLLFLTVDHAEHGLALSFVERLPQRAKSLLLRPQVSGAVTVAQGFDDYVAEEYSVERRYRKDKLEATLVALGLDILDRRAYLTSLGAAHYEFFHMFRGVEPQRGLGRFLHMLSSLVLFPFVVHIDGNGGQGGYGLVFVARKSGAHTG
jgi:ubiquinone/menaquinone biosynthesis C-methylase UbiE